MEENLFLKNEEWGEGEWLNEPGIGIMQDFEYKGYKCCMRRNDNGVWCGYVAITMPTKWSQEKNYNSLDIHGGITFARNEVPLYGTPSPDIFWIGFDCNHEGDYAPRLEKLWSEDPTSAKNREKELEKFLDSLYAPEPRKTYRTMEYARNELKKLVDQIDRDK